MIKQSLIKWLSKDEGGLGAPSEASALSPYTAVVWFPATGPLGQSLDYWTLKLTKVSDTKDALEWIAEVCFLFDDAPHTLLAKDAVFELYEGRRCVARGKVLN